VVVRRGGGFTGVGVETGGEPRPHRFIRLFMLLCYHIQQPLG
jgi:hypothetical protein